MGTMTMTQNEMGNFLIEQGWTLGEENSAGTAAKVRDGVMLTLTNMFMCGTANVLVVAYDLTLTDESKRWTKSVSCKTDDEFRGFIKTVGAETPAFRHGEEAHPQTH